MDEIRYQFDDALRAFDVLFKLFITLKVCYPPSSEHIYELIEVGIFKSERETLKNMQYYADILSFLSSASEESRVN